MTAYVKRRANPGKYLAILRASLANLAAYRARIATTFVFFTMIMFVFAYLWKAIYKGGEIAGYSLERIIWYLCVTEIISFGARSKQFAQIGQDIRSGDIAYQLGRPYNFVHYHLTVSASDILFNVTLLGALALVIGFVFAGPIPGYNFLGLPLGILSMMLGILLQFYLHMCLALTALWIENADGAMLIANKLIFMFGTFLPLEFLPTWLQNISRALPFSYVAWGPARLVVNFSWADFCAIVPIQLFWLVIFLILSQVIFKRGMRALESHGG